MPETTANPLKMRLTLLKAANQKGVRKIVALAPDGRIVKVRDYPGIRLWKREQVEIAHDIDALSDFISALSNRPDCCLVTGKPAGDIPLDKPARRLKLQSGDDQPTLSECHGAWLPVDCDKIPLPEPLDPHDPESAISSVVARLGSPFTESSYVWQLTASASPGADRLSVRLFFLVDKAITNADRKRWAAALNADSGVSLVDTAPFNAAQPIYTATPDFQGDHDPFTRRTGVIYGENESVPWGSVHIPEKLQGTNSGTEYRGSVHRSIEEHLAAIGDAPGQEGFHQPIRDAVYQMVYHRWTVDRIKSVIRSTVAAADQSRHDSTYLQSETSDTALNRSIKGADQRIKSTMALPRATQTRMIDDAIPVDEASKMIYDIGATWVRGEGHDKMVLDVTVGAGKTTQVIQAIKDNLKAGETLLWAFPTHDQGAEVLEKFNADRPMAVRIEGRVRDDSPPLCSRPHLIEAIREAGLARYTSSIACDSRTEEGHQVCPHWYGCQYNQQFTGDHSIRLIPHDYLSIAKSRVFAGDFMKNCVGMVIDESALEAMVGHQSYALGDVLIAGGALAEAIQMFRDDTQIPDDMAERLQLEMDERCKPIIPMHGPGGHDEWGLMNELRSMGKSKPRFSSIYRAAIARLDGDINSLWFGRDKDGHELVLAAWRHSLPEGISRVLVLDGTADHETYRALLGDNVEIVRINVEQNLEIVQAHDIPLGKKHLTDPENHGALTQSVALARSMGAGLITNKAAIELAQSKGYLPDDHPVGHFNALRGMNSMESLDALVIAGRPEPDARSVEAVARALWPREAMELTGGYVWRADGVSSVASHPDARCDGLLRAYREAEINQAIGRLRAVRSTKPKRVVLLTHTPTGLPVTSKPFADIVMPVLISRLLLIGNGVAPLAPTLMSSLLPDAWATPKAAKRWLENLKAPFCLSNTLHKEIGAFKFRAKGQKRHSVAISWREIEDVWEQLEKITGMDVVECRRVGNHAPTWEKPVFTVTTYQFKSVELAPDHPLIWERPAFTVKNIGTGAMLPLITRLRRLWEDIIDAIPNPLTDLEPAFGGIA